MGEGAMRPGGRRAGSDLPTDLWYQEKVERIKSGLWIEDVVVGTGAEVTKTSRVRVECTTSLNHGEIVKGPDELVINLRQRHVVAGLRYGLIGMRVGGERRIRTSPHLAYRDTCVFGVPPNAILIFGIRLLEDLGNA